MYISCLNQIRILMRNFCFNNLSQAIPGATRVIVRMVVGVVMRTAIISLNIIQHTYSSVAVMVVRHGRHDHQNQADKHKEGKYVWINLHAVYFFTQQR